MSPRSTDALSTSQDPRLSQSLERDVVVLRWFTREKQLPGIKVIASELGMSPSITHRYVITLVALGWLEQLPSSDRKYRLSLRVTDVGMAGS
jgi:DNA-binding IclR family transcriptional regulator